MGEEKIVENDDKVVFCFRFLLFFPSPPLPYRVCGWRSPYLK